MEKQVHVNSYVKQDGTQVKEHFRTIDTDNYATPPIVPESSSGAVLDEQNHNPLEDLFPNIFNPAMNIESGAVLQGSVSSTDVNWGRIFGNIGDALGTVVSAGIELAPIALQMYQAMNSGNGQAVEYLKPQFDTKIKQLDTKVAQMKTNIDNNITKLVNAKNQSEYSKIYEPLQKDWQAYQHAKNIVNRIKIHASNSDFQSVANEFGNFTSNNKKQFISDLLQPNTKLQNLATNFSQNKQNMQNKMTLNEKLINALGKVASPKMKVAGANLQNAMQNFKYANKNPNAHILNSRAEITNRNLNKLLDDVRIPKDTRGVIYDNNSEQSKLLWQSPEIQGFVKNNLQDLLSNNTKEVYDIEFINRGFPSDNYYGLQHCKLFSPQITPDGYFKGIIVDYYDFDKRIVNGMGDYINNWGYSMQEKGFLENIFNIYIIFEKL